MKKTRVVASIGAVVVVAAAIGGAIVLHGSSSTPNSPSANSPSGTPSSPNAPATASHGVYIANFFAKADPKLLSNPNIDGSFQAYRWSTLEPAKGDFQWKRFDADMRVASANGKKIALGIDTGSYAPEWAKPHALTFVIAAHNGAFGHGQRISVPIPWDTTYESNVHDVANAVAAHLHSTGFYDLVTQIKLTGITETTEETRMPAQAVSALSMVNGVATSSAATTDATPLWHSNGYTRSQAEDAWKTMAGYWAAAFPDKTLAMPTIPSGGFPNIDDSGRIQPGKDTITTQDLVEYGTRTWGRRFMVMHNSLSDTSTPTNQALQVKAFSEGASVGFQFDDQDFGQVDSAPESRFADAANAGIEMHMTYTEVFRNDPAAYPSTIAHLHSELSTP
jgi:hypothetical protein